MTTLILIRHGESEANHQGIFAGQIDIDLHRTGFEQAMLTAKYITDNYKVDKIYSSDLQRAYKTAMCLAEMLNIKVIEDKNLREINAGKWEGMTFNNLSVVYPKEYNIWLNHIGHSYCVGGETVKQLADRIMRALTEIAKENDEKTVVIATHATPIRAAQSIIGSGTIEEMENIPWTSNASISVFEYDNDAWRIIEVSKDEHLVELKTVLPSNV